MDNKDSPGLVITVWTSIALLVILQLSVCQTTRTFTTKPFRLAKLKSKQVSGMNVTSSNETAL